VRPRLLLLSLVLCLGGCAGTPVQLKIRNEGPAPREIQVSIYRTPEVDTLDFPERVYTALTKPGDTVIVDFRAPEHGAFGVAAWDEDVRRSYFTTEKIPVDGSHRIVTVDR
jgi:hypothetical protein